MNSACTNLDLGKLPNLRYLHVSEDTPESSVSIKGLEETNLQVLVISSKGMKISLSILSAPLLKKVYLYCELTYPEDVIMASSSLQDVEIFREIKDVSWCNCFSLVSLKLQINSQCFIDEIVEIIRKQSSDSVEVLLQQYSSDFPYYIEHLVKKTGSRITWTKKNQKEYM